MKWINSLLFILLLQGCTLLERPPVRWGLNTQNCDPSLQEDCWAVKEKQLRAMADRLERLEKELDKLIEAYTFCKEGI